MRAALPVVGLALVVASCAPKKEGVGGECSSDYRCKDHLTCYQRVCRERGAAGASCDEGTNRHCVDALVCQNRTCMTPEEAEVAKRAAAAEREAELLRKSGIEPTRIEEARDVVETATMPAGAGAQVRVAETTDRGETFAACRANERLVGGGCRSDEVLRASFPSNHGETDTVGARWNCTLNRYEDDDVTAFALCQQLDAPAP